MYENPFQICLFCVYREISAKCCCRADRPNGLPDNRNKMKTPTLLKMIIQANVYLPCLNTFYKKSIFKEIKLYLVG